MAKKKTANGANGAPAKTEEERLAERRQRFLKLSQQRTLNAVHRISQCGNLGTKATYASTEAERQEICDALAAAVVAAVRALKREGKPTNGFAFSENAGKGTID